ncbi:unnamed protein product [Durusdinium trenchii]|uniref:Uncharacterized protein n=1 Tax=Durusdinium trenchii TaxID=1381693 RepID=A0ABP0IS69_9DINO
MFAWPLTAIGSWGSLARRSGRRRQRAKGKALFLLAEEKESKPGLTEEELDEIREEPRSVTGLKLIGEEAPSNLSWHYVLKDETTRSFVGFLPRTLSQDVCSSFF